MGGSAAEPRTGAIYLVAHENPGLLRLLKPGEGRRGGPPQMPPGQGVYQQHCQACHGANREGVAESGPALVQLVADPVNNIVAGAPRFTGEAARTVIATGKGRMPALPHLTATEVDNVVNFVTTPASGRGRGAGPGGGRGAAPVGSGAPPELIAGSGSAGVRPEAATGGRGRGAALPYPEGCRLHTLHHQRVQPVSATHQAAVHGDREVRPQPTGHQVADSVRRRSRTGRAWHHRHQRARHSEQHHCHRIGSRVRRRP